jgi:hypothetical protein
MSDGSNVANSLRERLGGTTEDRLGKALSELLESPLLTGAIGRVVDAREKAVQAQEVAMGALNIPSAADIERLTRRLRSVSYRLEAIEDGVGRLDRTLASGGVEARLAAIEEQLQAISRKIDEVSASRAGAASAASAPGASAAGGDSPMPAQKPKPKRAAKAAPQRAKPARAPKAGAKKA